MASKEPAAFEWQEIATVFDVPPWLVNTNYPPPRFARLRWKLRKVWKLPKLDVPAPPSYLAEMERAQQRMIEKVLYGAAYELDGERIDPRDVSP